MAFGGSKYREVRHPSRTGCVGGRSGGRHQGRKEPLRFQGSALDLVLLIRDLLTGPLPLDAKLTGTHAWTRTYACDTDLKLLRTAEPGP